MKIEDVKIEDLGQYLGLRRRLLGFSDEEILGEYERKQKIHRAEVAAKQQARVEYYYAEAEMMFNLGYYKDNMVMVMDIIIPMTHGHSQSMWTLTGKVLDWPDTVFGMVPWFEATNVLTESRYFHKHTLGCPVIKKIKEPNKTFAENINTEMSYTMFQTFWYQTNLSKTYIKKKNLLHSPCSIRTRQIKLQFKDKAY